MSANGMKSCVCTGVAEEWLFKRLSRGVTLSVAPLQTLQDGPWACDSNLKGLLRILFFFSEGIN